MFSPYHEVVSAEFKPAFSGLSFPRGSGTQILERSLNNLLDFECILRSYTASQCLSVYARIIDRSLTT